MADGFGAMMEKKERARVNSEVFPIDPTPTVIREYAGLEPPKAARGLIWHGSKRAILLSSLFYDQPIVEICPLCPLLEDLGLLRWMIQAGYANVALAAPYQFYPDRVLSVINGTPHISHAAMFQIGQRYAEEEDLGCLCAHCTREALAPHAHLQPDTQDLVRGYYTAMLAGIPKKLRRYPLGVVNELIMAGDNESLRAGVDQLNATLFLSQARSLSAVPEFTPKPGNTGLPGSKELDFLTESLGIAYSDDIPPREYAMIVGRYQGALSFLARDVSKGAIGRALDKVSVINGEIEEIGRSRRVKFVRLTTDIYREGRLKILEAALGGVLGLAAMGPIGGLFGVTAADRLGDLSHKALQHAEGSPRAQSLSQRGAARMLQKSIPAVQVWKIREKVEEKRTKRV